MVNFTTLWDRETRAGDAVWSAEDEGEAAAAAAAEDLRLFGVWKPSPEAGGGEDELGDPDPRSSSFGTRDGRFKEAWRELGGLRRMIRSRRAIPSGIPACMRSVSVGGASEDTAAVAADGPGEEAEMLLGSGPEAASNFLTPLLGDWSSPGLDPPQLDPTPLCSCGTRVSRTLYTWHSFLWSSISAWKYSTASALLRRARRKGSTGVLRAEKTTGSRRRGNSRDWDGGG